MGEVMFGNIGGQQRSTSHVMRVTSYRRATETSQHAVAMTSGFRRCSVTASPMALK